MSEFTKITNKLRGISPEVDALLGVLLVAESVTGIGGPAAAAALQILKSAFDAFAANSAGTMTDADFDAQLAQAHADLATVHSAEDAELAARFPGPPGAA